MFARKLQPQEYWRASLNMAVAFENPFEFEKEQEKAKTAEIDPKEDLYGAFLSQDEPPAASLVINKKEVRFDGGTVKMGGVGGVATLPAQRRGGAIRACMEASLRDLYDQGYALSHLYPFSTSYYRQFGFAPASRSVGWRIELKDLQRLPKTGGRVRQIFPGEDLAPLLEIYNKMYGDINFSCLREAFDKDLEGEKPLAQKRWIFLWEDDSGEPGAFLIGSRDKDDLFCGMDFSTPNGLLFASGQALTGLLRFVYDSFLANFRAIRFSVPAHIDLTCLLPELSGMGCLSTLNGMARAVNGEQLLRLCKCRGSGSLVIQVTDDILPENNGIFRLGFAPGQENTLERVDASPDIRLDVGNLAVLLGGARETSTIPMTPGIVTNTELERLAQVFYRKPCHILDLF